MALKKLCRCGKVIDYNFKCCKNCETKTKKERAKYNKHYDKYIRDKQTTAFYKSLEWLRTREFVLREYKGLDLYAFFIEKKIVYADTVHHIEELKENWERRFDIDNLIPLSSSNHNKIHIMYEKDKKNIQKLLFDLLKKWHEEYEEEGRGVSKIF